MRKWVVLSLGVLSLLPSVSAGEITSYGSYAFTLPDTFTQSSTSFDCKPELRNETLLADTNICHLLSGKKVVINADGKNFIPGSLKVRFYDVKNLTDQVLRYPELDKMVKILRSYLEVTGGKASLSSVGSDGRELYMPDGHVESSAAGAHFIEYQGQKKGIGFFHIEGSDTPGDVYYQAVFYDSERNIVGGVKYFIESGKSGGWKKYYDANLKSGFTREQFTAAFSAYVKNTLTPNGDIKNVIHAVTNMLVTSYQFRGFKDVAANSQFAEAIDDLKVRGIVNGYADGTYRPAVLLNRAEFLKLVVESSGVGEKELSSYAKKSCFSDISGSEWFAQYVCYGKAKGIIGGYKDGRFVPERHINLAEVAKMTVKALSLADVEEATGEQWYAPYIKVMNDKKLLTGISLKPSDDINRGQMAQILFLAK